MKTFFAAMLLAVPALGQTINDSDLAGGKPLPTAARWLEPEARREPGLMVFPLTRLDLHAVSATAGAVTGAVELLGEGGAWKPGRLSRAKLVGPGAPESWVDADGAGRFALAVPPGASGTFRVRVSLDNRYWSFHSPKTGAGYEWESPDFALKGGAGLDIGVISPSAQSDNAKLGVLHLTYLSALDFLKREADVDWWTNALTINWPGDADFFSPWGWSLDLTDATHWDVVLHELGHAVQAGSMQARSAGGSHKIDECYSPELAWSEGFASFFAAAVRFDRNDADAKFQFMVPRRAPIRVENVPDDVCKGEASEWRVFAGLWDLIDAHEDGLDRFAMGFPELWKSLRGQSMGSMTEAWTLIAKRIEPSKLRAGEDALIQNTLLPARPGLTVLLPRPEISFDGAPR
ncbi:MAG: hypothetical protein HY077_01500 [Elusimicrobia bacterium]|nr:hypothetical protein [Elusimicrobiota bacterium]